MRKIKDTIIFSIILVLAYLLSNYGIWLNARNTSLMNQIKENSDKYRKNPISAKVIGNKMIAGLNGVDVDFNKSYYNMYHYGNYNEMLMEFKEVKPTVSITNHYDKYLVRGNTNKHEVSLIFLVFDTINLEETLKILESKKVSGTFFIEGSLLDSVKDIIKKHKDFEYELFYDDEYYSTELFKSGLSYLKNITNNGGKYCYNRGEENALLEVCNKLKIHSIKPTVYLEKNIYYEVKNNLANAIIISMPINRVILKELGISIDYIKSHGYGLSSLDDLLQE